MFDSIGAKLFQQHPYIWLTFSSILSIHFGCMERHRNLARFRIRLTPLRWHRQGVKDIKNIEDTPAHRIGWDLQTTTCVVWIWTLFADSCDAFAYGHDSSHDRITIDQLFTSNIQVTLLGVIVKKRHVSQKEPSHRLKLLNKYECQYHQSIKQCTRNYLAYIYLPSFLVPLKNHDNQKYLMWNI